MPHFLDQYASIHHLHNRLPHWHQDGGIYFVTWRLSDSLPQLLLRQWECERDNWLLNNPYPHTPEQKQEYLERFVKQREVWLDLGHGSCQLRAPAVRDAIVTVINKHNGVLVKMFAYVLMPNHVHALFGLLGEVTVQAAMRQLKGATSNAAGKCFSERNLGMSETSASAWVRWNKDYFDRSIRTEEHFARCVRYIRNNPVRANLSQTHYTLFQSPDVQPL